MKMRYVDFVTVNNHSEFVSSKCFLPCEDRHEFTSISGSFSLVLCIWEIIYNALAQFFSLKVCIMKSAPKFGGTGQHASTFGACMNTS